MGTFLRTRGDLEFTKLTHIMETNGIFFLVECENTLDFYVFYVKQVVCEY
jgi:hypothetical protein